LGQKRTYALQQKIAVRSITFIGGEQQLSAGMDRPSGACFNFSLFHFYHTPINSSSRTREQTEQIL
jgi:hypothetical protein